MGFGIGIGFGYLIGLTVPIPYRGGRRLPPEIWDS